MRNSHILIVEDEPKIAAILRDSLVASGFSVQLLSEGSSVVNDVRQRPPRALLLDLMLPGKDGLSICNEIRAFSNVPILMITARIAELERLVGLEAGADDYICKPFSPREVIARLHAVLRRTETALQKKSELEINANEYSVIWRGERLSLTAVEFRILQKLSAHPWRVFNRVQLHHAAYLDHRVVSDKTIDTHIKNLRRKLCVCPPDPISTLYGVGFRFESP